MEHRAARTTISDVPEHVLQKHIFTRLPGPDLASAGSACSHFHSLSANETLWSRICSDTWPSTNTPRLRHVISTFPARSFFSNSFPLLSTDPPPTTSNPAVPPPELITSAVDIRHRGGLVLSRAVETETASRWFQNSPFRIDLLGPKESVEYPGSEAMLEALAEEMALSWIVIDAAGRRAVNVSSGRAVSVERHWLNGEVEVRFAAVAVETVTCVVVVVVTCGGDHQMRVREVSLQVEDVEGRHLNGRDSLGILQRSLEGKMGRRVLKRGEAKKRYEGFLESKKERRERKVRAQGRLDSLCVAFGVCVFSLFWVLVLC